LPLEALRRYQFNGLASKRTNSTALPLEALRWYQLNGLASQSSPSVPIQRSPLLHWYQSADTHFQGNLLPRRFPSVPVEHDQAIRWYQLYWILKDKPSVALVPILKDKALPRSSLSVPIINPIQTRRSHSLVPVVVIVLLVKTLTKVRNFLENHGFYVLDGW
jgi:hypothetical protein